jgi:hypothetical protein
MRRPLYPLCLGPEVELTDRQHVAAWAVTAVAVFAAAWLGASRG